MHRIEGFSLNGFKNLGIGVGLRATHYQHFLEHKPKSVSWVEVISENFMDWKNQKTGQRPLQTLQKVRQDYPVVLHGVSLSVGSCDPLDKQYILALKDLIHKIAPAWVSDHLCWTGVLGENLHDLLPIPYTEEALHLVTHKLKQVQDYLNRHILIENPSSYLQFENEDFTEWSFLAEVARAADCGILLDVNNIYVSSINHKFDPLVYLKSLPKERVKQIHLAGHTNLGTHLIDTHDAPVCNEVWDLYRWACGYFDGVSVMLERDDKIPAWEELELEIKKMAAIQKEENAKKISFRAANNF